MIANLPLLFAGGHPISLAKMVVHELECFITFLVHCSWGHDTAKNIQQPQWWPSNVTFSDPFSRPKNVPSDWSKRLQDLIQQCYVYHNSEFLLKFSEELARNLPSTLQYVDNCDRTTSLYERSSKRLLVTFRNENMLYDRKTHASRLCLLPKRQNVVDSMVQHVIAEIYLCDTCDDAFDSLEELRIHETECSERPSSPVVSLLTPEPCQKQELEQHEFMDRLGLQTREASLEVATSCTTQNTSPIQSNNRQKRSTLLNYMSCVPFSSITGRRMNKNRNRPTENVMRYPDHLDRYCAAPPLCLETPKWLNKSRSQNYHTKYKKTDNYWNRQHVFPEQRNKLIIDVKSQLLFLDCKPLWVNLKSMSAQDIKEYLDKLEQQKSLRKLKSEQDNSHEIEFVSVSVCDTKSSVDSNTFRRQRTSQGPSVDAPFHTGIISHIDIIDLCSDDDDVAPCPVACHASGEVVSQQVSVAVTPEFHHYIEPDSHLEAAHYSATVKRKFQSSNAQETELHKKVSKSFPTKELYINLGNSKFSNVISID